jgi:diaminopimelate decarboxylase
MIRELRADGHTIARADLGGGLGVPYRGSDAPPGPRAYAAMAKRLMHNLGVALIIEPGRSIAANAGLLLTRVIYVKEGAAKHFAILDAGMNDLLRPALYDAHHEIVCVDEPAPAARHARYDVVGPVCETADLFAKDRELPALKAGDLVAILSAGAYGAVMASAYNVRPPAGEVLVKGAVWSVVRQKLSDDALIGQDQIPTWLG